GPSPRGCPRPAHMGPPVLQCRLALASCASRLSLVSEPSALPPGQEFRLGATRGAGAPRPLGTRRDRDGEVSEGCKMKRLFVLMLVQAALSASTAAPGPQDSPSGLLHEQHYLIPFPLQADPSGLLL